MTTILYRRLMLKILTVSSEDDRVYMGMRLRRRNKEFASQSKKKNDMYVILKAKTHSEISGYE